MFFNDRFPGHADQHQLDASRVWFLLVNMPPSTFNEMHAAYLNQVIDISDEDVVGLNLAGGGHA